MSSPDQLLSIESKAIRLLAVREYSRYELTGRLEGSFADAVDPIQQVLDDLERRGLLSDERFTELFVRSRVQRGHGPLRISNDLKQRGIDTALIDQWLDFNDPDWTVQLVRVARQKFGEAAAQTRNEQAKRARFLSSRGYPEALIRRYLWD